MTKYDFGYEIQAGTTSAWALDCIPAGSRVLEFGPSIGYLTKALRNKSCQVDIVEIDAEAGALAAQYAEKALCGPEWGDIESLKWCKELQEASYDAIVFMDVLEHLHNPEIVLSQTMRFLKSSGRIYLSVPNVAHNSVIINLFNNKWEYTPLGLLDNTHVHFFTYYSLLELFHKLNLTVEYQGAIQKMVGDNEISNDYSEIPAELAALLKDRKYPDAYQFLFCLSRKQVQSESVLKGGELQLTKLPNTGQSVEFTYRYSGENAGFSELRKQYYPGPSYTDTLEIPYLDDACPTHLIIGFPFHSGIISGFEAVIAEQEPRGLSWISNGIQLENGDLVFYGQNKQIEIPIPEGIGKIELYWNVRFYDSDVIDYFASSIFPERQPDKRLSTQIKRTLKAYISRIVGKFSNT